MGEILGGRVSKTGAGGGAGLPCGGGLGDLLENIDGARTGSATGGGLGDLIGQLGSAARDGTGGSFGDLLNQALGNNGEPEAEPSAEQDAVAGLMLRAMIQTAKSDGRIDAAEKRKLMDNLGDISPAEQQFVQQELEAPVDIQELARQVPQGLEQQVYAMSVMAIDLDQDAEAQYLAALGQALGLDQRQVNAIHRQMGAPALYA